MGMMAVVPDDAGALHIVKWCGRSGLLSVGVTTYCGLEMSIANTGTYQVPENQTSVCESCTAQARGGL